MRRRDSRGFNFTSRTPGRNSSGDSRKTCTTTCLEGNYAPQAHDGRPKKTPPLRPHTDTTRCGVMYLRSMCQRGMTALTCSLAKSAVQTQRLSYYSCLVAFLLLTGHAAYTFNEQKVRRKTCRPDEENKRPSTSFALEYPAETIRLREALRCER